MAGRRKWWIVVLGLLLLPVAAVCVVVVGVVAWGAYITFGIDHKDVAATPPLSKVSITSHYGNAGEIFVTLAPGTTLHDALNLQLFDGFDPHMTAEEARNRLGPPDEERDDPFCRTSTPHYDRTGGAVSLCRYGTEGGHRWDIVAHPTACTPEYLFRDRRVFDQLRPWLVDDRALTVHVLRQVGWGGATVRMRRTACDWVMLTERE